jgi:hypothetical protein
MKFRPPTTLKHLIFKVRNITLTFRHQEESLSRHSFGEGVLFSNCERASLLVVML